jgi:hypothetical protein
MATIEDELRADQLPPDSQPKATRKRATRSHQRKKPASLEAPIRAMLETVGGVWHMSEATRGHLPVTDEFPTCGSVLIEQAPQIAKTLNTLANEDPNVYKWLSAMMTGGGWGSVILATWPVGQAVLAAHVIPAVQRRRGAEQIEAEGPAEWPSEQPPVEP